MARMVSQLLHRHLHISELRVELLKFQQGSVEKQSVVYCTVNWQRWGLQDRVTHTKVLESLKTPNSSTASKRGPDVQIVSLSLVLQERGNSFAGAILLEVSRPESLVS